MEIVTAPPRLCALYTAGNAPVSAEAGAPGTLTEMIARELSRGKSLTRLKLPRLNTKNLGKRKEK